MTARQLAWIFGTLAVMLGAWLLLRGDPGGGDGRGLDLSGRTGGVVDYVRIDRPGEAPMRLERRADGWTIDGYPASDSLVNATLAALDTLAPGRLVARSAGSHSRLGLTDSAAVRVRIGPPDEPALDILVGETGADGRFVRRPDDARAYAFPEMMDAFVADEGGWRDFTVARVDTAALRRIVIRRRGEVAAELVRGGADGTDAGAGEEEGRTGAGAGAGAGTGAPGRAWSVNGAPADTAILAAYLRTLARLNATGFPADSFVYAADFENPLASVELYDSLDPRRPPELALLLSTGLDHPDVLVRRADDPIVYALDPRAATLLTLPAERLQAGGAPGSGGGSGSGGGASGSPRSFNEP